MKKAIDIKQTDNKMPDGMKKTLVICCKLNKMPDGKLTSMNNATICDFNTPTASTVTSRYYKGIGAHKDNMVLEIWKRC